MPASTLRAALTSQWFDRYARFGYVAKGVAWAIVGVVALRLALGGEQAQADFSGALGEIAARPFHAVLLVFLSLGLLGYAAWRILQGALDVEGEGRDAWGIAKRASYIALGLWYGVFGVYALGILAGWSTEEDELRDWTAMALAWPGGAWLVGIAGAAVLASGLMEVYIAVTRNFEIEIGESDLGRFERVCVLCAGWFGHAARGLVYSALGFFVVRAAILFDPEEARGLAATFRELLAQPYGEAMVTFAGAGFVAFGVYCGLLALHRHIPNESIFRGRRVKSSA